MFRPTIEQEGADLNRRNKIRVWMFSRGDAPDSGHYQSIVVEIAQIVVVAKPRSQPECNGSQHADDQDVIGATDFGDNRWHVRLYLSCRAVRAQALSPSET